MTKFTRRQTNALLLAAGIVPLGARLADAETPETLAQKLTDALNGRLRSGCNGRFSVPKFELSGTRKNVVMRSSVRLDWPPGIRVRPFRSTGSSQQEAIVDMFYQALDTFHDPWPQCVNNKRRS
jgi:hypothetical protein